MGEGWLKDGRRIEIIKGEGCMGRFWGGFVVGVVVSVFVVLVGVWRTAI